jgi:hypothetical protein
MTHRSDFRSNKNPNPATVAPQLHCVSTITNLVDLDEQANLFSQNEKHKQELERMHLNEVTNRKKLKTATV